MGRGELVRPLGVSPGRESTIILIPVQVGIFLLITAVMVNWFAQMHRRSRRPWEAILARMSPDCKLAWTAATSEQAEALGAIWTRMPMTAFRDAGVMMEMADYAERNSLSDDPAQLHIIRSAALRLRFASTGAMIRRISLR